MLNSYFTHCKDPFVLYDNNIQMVVYSYSERSYSFAGCTNNRTSKSPSTLLLLKRYVPLDGNPFIFAGGKLLGRASKGGSSMQLPIESFNTRHYEARDV